MHDEKPFDDLLQRVHVETRKRPPNWSESMNRPSGWPFALVCPIPPCDGNLILWTFASRFWQVFSCVPRPASMICATPAQLVALLTKMAHNKLAMRARREYRQHRDIRRDIQLGEMRTEPMAGETEPNQQAVGRELIDRAFALMDAQVRDMAVCRAKGMEWSEIAMQIGGTADARRKQFQRAVDQIAVTLQIE